jgi:hypothetical protein
MSTAIEACTQQYTNDEQDRFNASLSQPFPSHEPRSHAASFRTTKAAAFPISQADEHDERTSDGEQVVAYRWACVGLKSDFGYVHSSLCETTWWHDQFEEVSS